MTLPVVSRPTHPAAEDGFDRWDVAANTHLLAMLRKAYATGHPVPGRPISYEAIVWEREHHWGRLSHNLDAGPAFTHNVALLVAAKNLWAKAMREAVYVGAETSVATQKRVWHELMKAAAAKFFQDDAAAYDGEGLEFELLERLRVEDPPAWLAEVRPRVYALGQARNMAPAEIEGKLQRYMREGPR